MDRCQADPAFLGRFRHTVTEWNLRHGQAVIERETVAEAAPIPSCPAQGVTASQGMTEADAEAFVKEWLPNVNMMDVGGWVASELEKGELVACPVCRFLCLPEASCRTCAVRGEASRRLFEMDLSSDSFARAAEDLIDSRRKQAEWLHDMSNNAYYGQEYIILSAMYAPVLSAQAETREAADATV